MSQPGTLAKLIAATGEACLAPIGCRRFGKTRTWISDQRYWLILVEFRPSDWQRGTYLNVGTMWLWRARKGLAFNTFRRVIDFAPFYGLEQFAPVAVDLATQAAREVERLREEFKSLSDICRHLVNHTSVLATIQECRALNSLTSDENCLDFLDTTKASLQY